MSLDDVPRELLLVFVGLALLPLLGLFGERWLRRRRARRRVRRAAEGERAAARLLEARGFTIEGFQVEGSYAFDIDTDAVVANVRADYIVSRNGERFVAEVKTGRLAPKIETVATRRQLLEYAHAFSVDGVLLVDVETHLVRRVVFHRAPSPRRWLLSVLQVSCAALLVLVVLLIMRVMLVM